MAEMTTLDTHLARRVIDEKENGKKVYGEIVESEKAFAVYGKDKKLIWFPRSQTKVKKLAGQDHVKVTLPVWLYEANKIQWSTKKGGFKS